MRQAENKLLFFCAEGRRECRGRRAEVGGEKEKVGEDFVCCSDDHISRLPTGTPSCSLNVTQTEECVMCYLTAAGSVSLPQPAVC